MALVRAGGKGLCFFLVRVYFPIYAISLRLPSSMNKIKKNKKKKKNPRRRPQEKRGLLGKQMGKLVGKSRRLLSRQNSRKMRQAGSGRERLPALGSLTQIGLLLQRAEPPPPKHRLPGGADNG